MTYATQQDMVDRFGAKEIIQRTDRTNVPPTTIDADVLGRALGDADAAIDGYLAARYVLPLATVPERLVRLAADIARYFLWLSPVEGPQRTAYEDAIAFLRDVSQGKAAIGGGIELGSGTASGPVQVAADARVFSRDSLAGY